MSAAPAPVEHTTHARLIVSTHRSALLRVTLHYRADDPLAVRMVFPAEYALEPDPLDDPADPYGDQYGDPADPYADLPAEPSPGPADGVEWVFARQLLAAGLDLPSGEGDVHVRPALGTRTVVELRSPEGVALLQFDRADLRRFLWHSYLAVPEGRELSHLDCDRALAELLA
ncbi:SsgA family sporulation/cell division regulator [Kitasatospora sp. YST-16]|uniref:SsgA family sporulation/cell division regulator n=1 Tax=Kitasatospora sp. YST-16 TaxID=2998080 RepID=UPI00228378FB|nr:SsgA family sporulation/cell division regulator [Kitasatospora sp. YST-16]WAL71979.1 SsgA family sporulation/cell division regulator [Kitasatospora sp. YST-16]WNW38026.1 SsgA family sporulation/cell division regulator [Streptomyces sp. Li-HN-5-13]